MENTISDIKRAVQQFAAVRGNKRRLARATGVAESTLTHIESDHWNPRLETLAALARAVEQMQDESASKVA